MASIIGTFDPMAGSGPAPSIGPMPDPSDLLVAAIGVLLAVSLAVLAGSASARLLVRAARQDPEPDTRAE